MVWASYGRRTPQGALPVYSVDTEEEAMELLDRACFVHPYERHSLGPDVAISRWVAMELVGSQTLENLYDFSDHLAAEHEKMKEERGRIRSAS